jgi:hypothetical protein
MLSTLDTRSEQLERLREASEALQPIEVAKARNGAFGDVQVSETGRLSIPVSGVERYIKTGGGASG